MTLTIRLTRPSMPLGYYENYNISTADKVTGSLPPFAGTMVDIGKTPAMPAITVVLSTTEAYHIKG